MRRARDEAAHRPALEIVDRPASEVPAGADLLLIVRLICPEGCDLRSQLVTVAGPGGAVASCMASEAESVERGSLAQIVVRAPAEVGEAAWTLTLAAGEVEGVAHEEATFTVTTTVVPHTTSVAVWSVPSPVKGSPFSVSVGVKCSVLCSLGGHRVQVRDEEGNQLAEAILGCEPRRGTDGLYEAQVGLVAPERAGVYFRRAHFPGSDLDLPHDHSEGTFSFRALEPPEHVVTVRMAADHEAPLNGIEVRLGPYRGVTDERGVAEIGVPKGTHELSAWRIDIESVSRELEVLGDAEVEISATPRCGVDEDERRLWM